MSDTTDGTDLEPRVPMNVATMDDGEIDRLYRIAKALAMSGMFKDARQAEQAFAKILLGRDLGLSPTQAMVGLHIVEGKPETSAVTLAGFVQQHPDYSYKVTEHDNDHCVIEFRDGDESVPFAERTLEGISTFTMADAERADLTKPSRNGSPSNYTKYPRNMLFSRAMSNGVKWFCPEVTRGIPVYHEGEIQRVENLAAGEGTGELPGVELPPEVERIIDRAARVGHAGLSDRATIEMTLGGQPPEKVAAWVTRATTTLDGMTVVASGEDREPDDSGYASEEYERKVLTTPGVAEAAEAVEEVIYGLVIEPPPSEDEARARKLEEKALGLMDQAESYRAEGKTQKADMREAEAEELIAEARAIGDPAQEDLGV